MLDLRTALAAAGSRLAWRRHGARSGPHRRAAHVPHVLPRTRGRAGGLEVRGQVVHPEGQIRVVVPRPDARLAVSNGMAQRVPGRRGRVGAGVTAGRLPAASGRPQNRRPPAGSRHLADEAEASTAHQATISGGEVTAEVTLRVDAEVAGVTRAGTGVARDVVVVVGDAGGEVNASADEAQQRADVGGGPGREQGRRDGRARCGRWTRGYPDMGRRWRGCGRSDHGRGRGDPTALHAQILWLIFRPCKT